jgi:topoisomerase-4 subunit A
LKRELELEVGELLDELHARTLERIFIEERVYKGIEKMKTQEGIRKAVLDGLDVFKKEIRRQVTEEDIERLLKIPIRRISLYDINRAKEEMDYAVSFLEGVAAKLAKDWPRRTALTAFTQVDVKDAARRDLPLRYDQASGYLGTAVSGGETLFVVSTYDKIIAIRRNGVYTAMTVPEKLFVDQGMLYCGPAEKEELAKLLFTLVYRDSLSGYAYIKRCRIETYISNRDYMLVPDGAQILFFTMDSEAAFTLKYVSKPRMKIKEESFKVGDFEEKGLKAQGVRLAAKEVLSVIPGSTTAGARAAAARDAELFGEEAQNRPGSKTPLKKPSAKGKRAQKSKQDQEAAPRGLKARAEALVRKAGTEPPLQKANAKAKASPQKAVQIKKKTIAGASKPARRHNKKK